MTGSVKVAVGLGVLCALLAGVLVGKSLGGGSESERYYARANLALDRIAPQSATADERASERETLMAAAKDIGVACLMCAGDNDDVLPGPTDFAQKIRPYMGLAKTNRLNDFEWRFHGGRQSALSHDEVTTGEIGRLSGQTGVAVVLLDGHAKWVPK